MKKQLSFTNSLGFILSYVLFLIIIIFIVLSASIHIYKKEMLMTAQHIEQQKIESLIQMGITMFKEELLKKDIDKDYITYTFPDGTVDILVKPLNVQYVLLLRLTVETDNDTSLQTRYVMDISAYDINVDSF